VPKLASSLQIAYFAECAPNFRTPQGSMTQRTRLSRLVRRRVRVCGECPPRSERWWGRSRSSGGRPGGRLRGYVHRRPTSSRCQRRIVAGRTDKPDHALRGSAPASAARIARSTGRTGARRGCLHRNANSCRSNRISSSFERSDLHSSATNCSSRQSPERHERRAHAHPPKTGKARSYRSTSRRRSPTTNRVSEPFGVFSIP
jgi:hypothetical protein